MKQKEGASRKTLWDSVCMRTNRPKRIVKRSRMSRVNGRGTGARRALGGSKGQGHRLGNWKDGSGSLRRFQGEKPKGKEATDKKTSEGNAIGKRKRIGGRAKTTRCSYGVRTLREDVEQARKSQPAPASYEEGGCRGKKKTISHKGERKKGQKKGEDQESRIASTKALHFGAADRRGKSADRWPGCSSQRFAEQTTGQRQQRALPKKRGLETKGEKRDIIKEGNSKRVARPG